MSRQYRAAYVFSLLLLSHHIQNKQQQSDSQALSDIQVLTRYDWYLDYRMFTLLSSIVQNTDLFNCIKFFFFYWILKSSEPKVLTVFGCPPSEAANLSSLSSLPLYYGEVAGVCPSSTWVKAGNNPEWVSSSSHGPMWAFGGVVPCSKVPQQFSAIVLAPPHTTRTPPNLWLQWGYNQEPSGSQAHRLSYNHYYHYIV